MNTRFPSVQVLSSDRQRDCRSPRREVSKSFGGSDMSLLTGPVTTLRDLVDHVPTRESCASTNVVSIKPKPAIALLVFIVECCNVKRVSTVGEQLQITESSGLSSRNRTKLLARSRHGLAARWHCSTVAAPGSSPKGEFMG